MAIVVSRGRNLATGRMPQQDGSVYIPEGATSISLLRGQNLAFTFEQVVRSQPWVFAAVTRCSFKTARVPLKLYDGEFSDDRQRVRDGDLAELLSKPNPHMRFPTLRLEEAWDFYTHGRSLVLKYRTSPGAPPSELWWVPWTYVMPYYEGSRLVAWQIMLADENFTVTPSDVIYSQWPHGIPPLEALTRTVQIEDAAMTYQAESLKGGVTPKAAFSTDKPLNPSDMKKLRTELTKLYAGAEKAGNFVILDKDLKYQEKIGVSPVDMALPELRKLGREEVAAAFDVTPPFLGILDRATFNNITELRRADVEDSLGPKLEIQESAWQCQLIDCEPVWSSKGYRCEYDINAILKASPEGQARRDLMDQQSSTWSIDERCRRIGKPPFNIPGVTDVPLIPVNMVPAGSAVSPPAPPPAGADPSALLNALLIEAFRQGQTTPPEPAEVDE